MPRTFTKTREALKQFRSRLHIVRNRIIIVMHVGLVMHGASQVIALKEVLKRLLFHIYLT